MVQVPFTVDHKDIYLKWPEEVVRLCIKQWMLLLTLEDPNFNRKVAPIIEDSFSGCLEHGSVLSARCCMWVGAHLRKEQPNVIDNRHLAIIRYSPSIRIVHGHWDRFVNDTEYLMGRYCHVFSEDGDIIPTTRY